MVLRLGLDAALDQGVHHLVADVHHLVGRRDREVAFLVADLVAQVRVFLAAAIPLAFATVDEVVARVGRLVEADVVENEELKLRAHEARVGDAGALEIGRGLAGDVARIAAVVLAGDRVLDVADHRQGLDRAERVEDGGFGLRDDEHVALVDPLPAADAGAVEAQAVLEDVLVELVDGNGEVLPEAGEVHEAEIDRLDVPSRGRMPILLWVSRVPPFGCFWETAVQPQPADRILAPRVTASGAAAKCRVDWQTACRGGNGKE